METTFATPTTSSRLNLMPVDVSLMSTTLRNLWNTTYASNCYEPYLSTPETDYRDKFYFDMDFLTTSKDQADWLRIFRDVIWYEEAIYYIEATHRVKNRATLDRIGSPTTTFASCDLNAIKSKVGNYDTDHYDTYLEFTRSGTTATPVPHGAHALGRFSLQLIRSIVETQDLGPNPRFDFFDDGTVQFFRVQNKKGFLYYDFSDNPKIL
ncbi:MAG TPA: hypothetical protein VK183_00505 [Flavobacterium sp.]|nr:hypothetical protein [Flavobacterium sp.]